MDQDLKRTVTLNYAYAPLDVFDWCDIISMESQRVVGKKGNGEDKHPTQEEIGERLGLSQQYVQNFTAIAVKISSPIYQALKHHQLNRGDQEPLFEFTEGWFRNHS